MEKILSVSHRWMTPQEPDPDGEQLKALKTFLKSDKGREIALVWIDGGSMPQDQPEGVIISQPKTSFLGVVFDVDHDFEGHRAPKAHPDTVLTNLSHHLGTPFMYACASLPNRKDVVGHGRRISDTNLVATYLSHSSPNLMLHYGTGITTGIRRLMPY